MKKLCRSPHEKDVYYVILCNNFNFKNTGSHRVASLNPLSTVSVHPAKLCGIQRCHVCTHRRQVSPPARAYTGQESCGYFPEKLKSRRIFTAK